MSSTPDYLYDEDPTPFHTGTPKPRRRLMLTVLGATVFVAVAMAWFLPLVQGSATEQSEQTVGVFVRALDAGDTSTAYSLLCDAERARLTEAELTADYQRPGTPTVVSSREEDGDPPRVTVEVRWTDGGATTTTEITAVPENGARVCGSG